MRSSARSTAFYLDIAQWAMEEPTRWGIWAAPCPIRRAELGLGKEHRHRKVRMDQCTRQLLPALPELVARIRAHKQVSAQMLAAAAAGPGEMFTAGGQRLHQALNRVRTHRQGLD